MDTLEVVGLIFDQQIEKSLGILDCHRRLALRDGTGVDLLTEADHDGIVGTEQGEVLVVVVLQLLLLYRLGSGRLVLQQSLDFECRSVVFDPCTVCRDVVTVVEETAVDDLSGDSCPCTCGDQCR